MIRHGAQAAGAAQSSPSDGIVAAWRLIPIRTLHLCSSAPVWGRGVAAPNCDPGQEPRNHQTDGGEGYIKDGWDDEKPVPKTIAICVADWGQGFHAGLSEYQSTLNSSDCATCGSVFFLFQKRDHWKRLECRSYGVFSLVSRGTVAMTFHQVSSSIRSYA